MKKKKELAHEIKIRKKKEKKRIWHVGCALVQVGTCGVGSCTRAARGVAQKLQREELARIHSRSSKIGNTGSMVN